MPRQALSISSVPVALLAGGLATRLRPMTLAIPKALVEVAGRPFIDHQLELLARNGITRVVLCLGHLGEMVREHCGEGGRYGLELHYSFDGGGRLAGTGGALRRAARLLGPNPDDAFWVMYGDSYMDIDYPAVLDFFGAIDPARGDGLMTVLRNEDRWDRSNVEYRDGLLLRYDKRVQTPEMRHIDYGAALLRNRTMARVPEAGAFDLADLYAQLVREGRMAAYEVHNRFYEIGTPASLAEARKYLRAKEAACRSRQTT